MARNSYTRYPTLRLGAALLLVRVEEALAVIFVFVESRFTAPDVGRSPSAEQLEPCTEAG